MVDEEFEYALGLILKDGSIRVSGNIGTFERMNAELEYNRVAFPSLAEGKIIVRRPKMKWEVYE